MLEELAEQWPLPLSKKRNCRGTRGEVPAQRTRVGHCVRSTTFLLGPGCGFPGFCDVR